MSMSTHPAQLWIGQETFLEEACILSLQHELCSAKGCSECWNCMALKKKQHAQVIWLEPLKGYTRADCAIIFEKTSFKLDDNQRFFFIIPRAELLNEATANSLLKTMEEPPAGYHFILFTQRPGSVLATIASRCVIIEKEGRSESSLYSDLFSVFIHNNKNKSEECHRLTELYAQDYFDAHAFVKDLLSYWKKQHKEKIKADDHKEADYALSRCLLLNKALAKMPMPGSTKQFLRNLFLLLRYH